MVIGATFISEIAPRYTDFNLIDSPGSDTRQQCAHSWGKFGVRLEDVRDRFAETGCVDRVANFSAAESFNQLLGSIYGDLVLGFFRTCTEVRHAEHVFVCDQGLFHFRFRWF